MINVKVLFISENYYPNFSGVPVVVQYLAETLAKKGNDVTVLTKKMGDLKQDDCLNGVKIHRIGVFINCLKFYRGDIESYIKYIKEFNADVYIFEGATVVTTDLFLPYLAELDGIKLLHSHGFSRLILKPFEKMSTLKNTLGNTYNYIRWKGYFKKTLPKYINEFDGVICLSKLDSSYDYLRKIYCKTVYTLGNAADDIFFCHSNNTISRYTEIEGDGYLLSVANYDAVKNQIGILQEFYKSKITNYDLVFIGREKNYYYQALVDENERLKQKYGKRNIHFLTNVDRNDIPGIYEYASLYLVASTAEGYSISIIEAMAKGIPFISTNVGNAKELLGGIVIDSIEDMSCKIRTVLNNKEIYKELSKQGKLYALTNCRIETACNKLINIIKESEKK